MKFNIVTNIVDQKGLFQDFILLKDVLESWGHYVSGSDIRDSIKYKADVNIFLERPLPDEFEMADQNWLIPNPEWWFYGDNHLLEKFDRIICKTRHAEMVFTPFISDRNKLVYTGFFSEIIDPDRLIFSEVAPDADIKPSFLHIAGDSIVKGTTAILDAWEIYDLPYNLFVISRCKEHEEYRNRKIRNVHFYNHVSRTDLKILMRQIPYNLCPSEYEGWGHSMHEAMSAGQVIITTEAAPMTEAVYDAYGNFYSDFLLLPPSKGESHGLITWNKVSPKQIARSVLKIGRITADTFLKLSKQSVDYAKSLRSDFENRFRYLID